MNTIAPYVFFWNTWVVFPAFLVVAVWAYWKFKKRSLAVLSAGLALFLVAEGLRAAFPTPLHPAHVASLIVGAAALAAMLAGVVWFMWKDYRGQKSAT